MNPAQFWRMTPYEISKSIEAYAHSQKEKKRGIIEQAWLISALVWQKKLPKLDKLLKDIDKPQPRKKTSTDAELIEAAKAKGLKGPWD